MNPISSQDRQRHYHLRALGWGGLLVLLLVPAVAMQFETGVNWGPGDFLLMGGMFVLLGLALEFALVSGRTRSRKAVFAGLALLAFLLVWAELAVGIFH